jgi:hypothetical protein
VSDVFCERRYRMILDGSAMEFPVRWFRPEPFGQDFSCWFEIDWPHRERSRARTFGVDAVQALLLAMEGVCFMLYRASPPVFLWEPDDILRLPVAPGFADLEAARTRGR